MQTVLLKLSLNFSTKGNEKFIKKIENVVLRLTLGEKFHFTQTQIVVKG